MHEWVLKIELNGEWEECSFFSRNDALCTFVALAEDYERNLQRAILFSPELQTLCESGAPSVRPN